MIYNQLTKTAINICYRSFKGTEGANGVPLVFTIYDRASKMETPEEIAVALLYPVMEKIGFTDEEMDTLNFPSEVKDSLHALRHDARQPYIRYVAHVSENEIARKVLAEDLREKLSEMEERRANASSALAKRYKAALEFLTMDDKSEPEGKEKKACKECKEGEIPAETPVRRSIPEKYRWRNGYRRLSNAEKEIRERNIKDIECPCCGEKALRMAETDMQLHTWVTCDNCGWDAPTEHYGDYGDSYAEFCTWYAAFIMLGRPKGRVYEDLTKEFGSPENKTKS